LKSISAIDVSENNLSGRIPSSIAELVTLEEIEFAKNNFSGNIPDGLENLKFLTKLDLSHNQLEGQIPASLAKLSNLKYTYLDNNKLEIDNLSDELISMIDDKRLRIKEVKLTKEQEEALKKIFKELELLEDTISQN